MKYTRRIQTLDGLPVHDALSPLWLDVIPADIREEARRDPEHCVLAACAKREHHALEARAYLSRLYLRLPGQDFWLRYHLPESVRQEVAAFDRGGGFSEGSYRVIPLQPKARSGGPSQGGKSTRTGTGPKRTTHREVLGLRSPSPLHGGALEHLEHPKKD